MSIISSVSALASQHKTATRIAGAAVAGGGVLALAACGEGQKHGIDLKVDSLIAKYDEHTDGELDLKHETHKQIENHRAGYWSGGYDANSDGDYNDLGDTARHYVSARSWTEHHRVTALATAADTQHGNKNGKAERDELIRTMKKFDTGNTKIEDLDKRKLSAGDDILQGSEWEAFETIYGNNGQRITNS